MIAGRTAAYDDPAAVAARDVATWFMDYRNADGSVSEMCGNGVRVFARYLADHGAVPTTRAAPGRHPRGVKVDRFEDDGRITVDMGEPDVDGETKVGGRGAGTWAASNVGMGNPHAVAFVDSLDDAGPLLEAPSYDPQVYPHGVNVEFVVRRGPSGTSRCGCTSAARGRPGPAARAPAR